MDEQAYFEQFVGDEYILPELWVLEGNLFHDYPGPRQFMSIEPCNYCGNHGRYRAHNADYSLEMWMCDQCYHLSEPKSFSYPHA